MIAFLTQAQRKYPQFSGVVQPDRLARYPSQGVQSLQLTFDEYQDEWIAVVQAS